MNEPIFFTHAEWQVLPGREEEFIAAWQDLANVFSALPSKPLWGTLLRSEEDPTRFFSFGPWASKADINAMRANPVAQMAIERVSSPCLRATPSTYRQVAHVDLR